MADFRGRDYKFFILSSCRSSELADEFALPDCKPKNKICYSPCFCVLLPFDRNIVAYFCKAKTKGCPPG